jgi:hypothetical protein
MVSTSRRMLGCERLPRMAISWRMPRRT